MKKLPKIYQNNIDKKINNNKEIYYLRNKNNSSSEVMSSNDIDEFLNHIFNGIGYAFNIPVIIKTNNKVYDTSLIARTGGYVLTLDDDKIKLDDIISIKRKNP